MCLMARLESSNIFKIHTCSQQSWSEIRALWFCRVENIWFMLSASDAPWVQSSCKWAKGHASNVSWTRCFNCRGRGEELSPFHHRAWWNPGSMLDTHGIPKWMLHGCYQRNEYPGFHDQPLMHPGSWRAANKPTLQDHRPHSLQISSRLLLKLSQETWAELTHHCQN